MSGERSWDDKDDERDDRRQLGRLVRISHEESADDDKTGQAQFSNVKELSDEQDTAYKGIKYWLRTAQVATNRRDRMITLGGYAGTGKTTLLGILAADLCRSVSIAFCTLTGKASSVLERSLRANGVEPAYCGTIHRLMYRPKVNEHSGAVDGWEKQKELEYGLIVVDEASMISNEILDDLLSYDIPILCVGDHGQLPPVGEDVGVMMMPDLTLETVRRQALDNPIIALSQLVRQGGDWQKFAKASRDPRVRYLDAMDVTFEVMGAFRGFQERSFVEDPLVLCGMNKTRAMLNKAARATLKADSANIMVKGERVICLRNQYLSGMLLANGFRGKVTGMSYASNPAHINAKVLFPDEGIELHEGLLCKAQFGADKTFKTFVEVSPQYRSWMEAGILMDYGYALTVHKAQGSQADKVIGLVERMGTADDARRHLYTMITRATKELVLAF